MSGITYTSPATTPEDLRARAAAREQEAERSFRDCDTDGFLTQWAHGINAQKDRLQAAITEGGGTAEFAALFDLDGNLIAAKYVETRFGYAWGILADDDPHGRIVRWVNASEAKKAKTARANDAKKGFYIGIVAAPAVADLHGGNACTVTAYPKRTDGGFSRDVTIIDNGHGENAGSSYRDW